MNIQGTPWAFAQGQSRAQTVKLANNYTYDSQPSLEFVGSTADVSFLKNDETLNLKSAQVLRGAGKARTKGNTVEISGIGCGQLIELCLTLCDGKKQKVKFTMKGESACL